MKKIFFFICLVVINRTFLFAQTDSLVIPLWKNGAPGFENKKNEPEQAKDYWIKNVHNPSVTVYFPPAEISNGTAVLICPGGGHRLLVYKAEGTDPARYLNTLGITAIVLKYRLAREPNSPYSLDVQPREDAYRAMRLIRSLAKELKIDTNRIGIMGFSAGGELVNSVGYVPGYGNPLAADPIDRLNGRPDFIMQIYPGPLFVPDHIPQDAPPAFLVVANHDTCCSGTVMQILERYRASKASVEVHLMAFGVHGFKLGSQSAFQSLKYWPRMMAYWLADNKLIQPELAEKK